MSKMIDGLFNAARGAGDEANERLTARSTIDSMEAQVRAGVRRRRQRIGAIAAVSVLVAGASAVVAPNLLADAPMPPIEVEPLGPEVVRTDGGLAVYADGSMSVLTQRGDVVDFEAPLPGSTPYATATVDQACLEMPDNEVGWTYASDDARALLGFGRPQYVDEGLRRTAVQGQVLEPTKYNKLAHLTFQLEADAVAAENIGFRATEVWVTDGMPWHYIGMLDGAPTVEVQGDGGNQVASVNMRVMTDAKGGYCSELAKSAALSAEPYGIVTRYLVVDAFLIDREGSATLLGTHTSWTRTEFTQ